jgi:hypothetical protein
VAAIASMKSIIELGIFGLVIIVILATCGGRLDDVVQPAKEFDELNEVEKHIMQYDSVYGDYLEWTGIQELGSGDPEAVTRRLVLDKPNRFAIKAGFEDNTGFFMKVPGDINFSGQWIEEGENITLKFYYPPVTWHELFDSLKNENNVRPIDSATIELHKDAMTIWMMGTACERTQ